SRFRCRRAVPSYPFCLIPCRRPTAERRVDMRGKTAFTSRRSNDKLRRPVAMEENWPQAVRSFWFEELKPEQWFQPDPALDRTIAERFGELHRRLKDSLPAAASTEPLPALAAIIVFDQLPRNMSR